MSAPPIENVLSELMGEGFNRLHPLLQRIHTGSITIRGDIDVYRGGFIAQCICNVFRFPPQKLSTLVTVHCLHEANSIRWVRYFDAFQMASTFSRHGEYLVEHLYGGSFDLLNLYCQPCEENGGLNYRFTRIPVPAFLRPNIFAREYEQAGKYHFQVHVSMPLIGKVLSYGGEMAVVES